jgi:hypothetical protein
MKFGASPKQLSGKNQLLKFIKKGEFRSKFPFLLDNKIDKT